ncbi:hypothetical protein M408DRAFT_325959 [Serendipita vermifera MAFF 305830]|uniref:26S proteasome complex subunit SEM1 n=1 Tax=Serendipita vermifera MAFF 305830 TaxID=933852 RepID=A0A0C3BNY9_SERVB|nr:hypothetical protein M408DRAFT_325959 [Serendipita vermifera MAFF 305830]
MADSSATAKDVSMDDKNAEKKAEESQQPQLGVLEEDDEFEEFAVQEWKDEETDVAKYLEQSGATGGGGAPSHLWEDSWDDDDVEEDFSVQLREELAKAAKPEDAMVS